MATHFDPKYSVGRSPINNSTGAIGEVRWLIGSETNVGGVAVPRAIEIEFMPAPGGTGALVTVEVIDGIPGVTGLEVYGETDRTFVTTPAVTWIAKNLDRLVTDALRVSSLAIGGGGWITFPQSPAERDQVQKVIRTLAARRKVDRAELERIAATYNANPDSPRQAVQRVHFLTVRTADRRIADAKVLRLIGQEHPIAEPIDPTEPADMSHDAQQARAEAALKAMNLRTEV